MAIDGYMASTFNISCDLSSLPLPNEANEFVAAATAAYSAVQPSFKALNASQVTACTQSWQNNYNIATSQAQVISRESHMDHIKFFGSFATDEDVEAMITAQLKCNLAAVVNYFSFLIDKKQSPETAMNNTFAVIDKLYATGECTGTP